MRRESFDLSGHNAQIFFDPKLPEWYERQSLCPAETMIFLRHRNSFYGKRVLDVGVGSGRTTRYLLPFAADYLGVDLSPVMLERARWRYPTADLRALDLRELNRLESESFDFVLASWAVLDAVTHDERLKTIGQVADRLRPGGLFVFSSHNRRSELAGRPPELERSAWPDRMARHVAHYLVAQKNYRRLRPLRHEERDYAMLNDMAHGWKGVFYYIDRDAQERQIRAAGLELIEIVGEDGRTLPPGDEGVVDGALHYVCRKAPDSRRGPQA